MSNLNCPRCGYVMIRRRDDDIEHCPRCLAQTAGALSIRLEPGSRKELSSSSTRDVISRLTRRVRVQLSR
jgi:transposase